MTITGVRSRLASHAFVYLPPQYFQAAYRRRAFPAAQVFTGFPGTDLNLLKGLDFPAPAARRGAGAPGATHGAGDAAPLGQLPARHRVHRRPQRAAGAGVLRAGRAAGVAGHYRVQTRGWGAIGDSTGGYCAAKLAMLHSDVFTAAVTLSGYFHTLRDSTTGELWGGSRVLKNLNNLEWRLRHLPPPPVSLLVTTAKDEAGSSGYADSRRFLRPGPRCRGAAARGVPGPGPRRPQLQHLERRAPPALSWLTQRLPAPPPSADSLAWSPWPPRACRLVRPARWHAVRTRRCDPPGAGGSRGGAATGAR